MTTQVGAINAGEVIVNDQDFEDQAVIAMVSALVPNSEPLHKLPGPPGEKVDYNAEGLAQKAYWLVDALLARRAERIKAAKLHKQGKLGRT